MPYKSLPLTFKCEWCGGPSKYEGVCVLDHRRRWSRSVVGQTANIAPGPVLATQHYDLMLVMSRGERLCERVPVVAEFAQ